MSLCLRVFSDLMRPVALLLLGLFLYGYPHPGTAQNVDLEAFDRYVAQGVETTSLPGLAIGILKDGQTAFSKGYGTCEAGQNEPVDENTVFAIASLSKAFTAAAVGILVDEGKLDWDDRVIKHLPGFLLHHPYVTREIRVIDLLCHRSGLGTFDGDLLWYGTSYSRREVIQRIRHMPLRHPFRYTFGYQNVMYMTAGELVAAVSGMSWEQFVEQRIFKPLGMNNSTTTNAHIRNQRNVAHPHINGEAIDFMSYDAMGPAGSINSTVADLGKWVQMWLNGGKVGNRQLLQPETVDKLLAAHTPMKVRQSQREAGMHFHAYGLGWFLFDMGGRKVAEHGGGLPGFILKITMVPEENLGVIVLTNDMSPLPNALRSKVLDLYLEDRKRDWVAEAVARNLAYEKALEQQRTDRRARRLKNAPPPLDLSQYAGRYEDEMYGPAQVDFSNGQLTLTLIPTKTLFTSEMEPWHSNTFRIRFRDPFLPEGYVTFELDADASILGFRIDLPNPDFHFDNLHFLRETQE